MKNGWLIFYEFSIKSVWTKKHQYILKIAVIYWSRMMKSPNNATETLWCAQRGPLIDGKRQYR